MAELPKALPNAAVSRRQAAERLLRWRKGWLTRLVGRLTTYLPLLLMALLALSTWWLVKSTPMVEDPRQAAPLRHVPDYTMDRFTVQRFGKDGALRAQIEGDQARHYPDTDTLEIDNARIRSVAEDGRVTLASGRRAISNGAATEVQLMGAAHVVREGLAGEPPLDFKGEFLHAFLETEQVRSHLPVVVTRGPTRMDADSMVYNNVKRTVQVKGRVRATFVSRGAAAAKPASGAKRP